MTDDQWGRRVRPPTRTRAVALGASVLLIGGLAALASGAVANGAPFGGGGATVTLAKRTLPGRRLDLATGGADVRVHTWNRARIRVTATAQGARRGDTVEVGLVGATVRVRDHLTTPSYCLFCRRRLHYDVWVPARAAAHLRTTSGAVTVDGLGGGMTLVTESGDLSLRHSGGALDARTASGNVVLDAGRVTGATVRTESGDITLAGVAGALHLQSASGNVTVRAARDSVLAIATASGTIDYTGSLASRGTDTTASASGAVTLRLPTGSRFQLDARTASGGLHDGFGLRHRHQDAIRLSGTAGDGAARLRITTESGDIAIERH